MCTLGFEENHSVNVKLKCRFWFARPGRGRDSDSWQPPGNAGTRSRDHTWSSKGLRVVPGRQAAPESMLRFRSRCPLTLHAVQAGLSQGGWIMRAHS